MVQGGGFSYYFMMRYDLVPGAGVPGSLSNERCVVPAEGG
jgi:hypothetical protein